MALHQSLAQVGLDLDGTESMSSATPIALALKGVSEGEHEIIMQGRILDQQEWLKSDPIKVVLKCN